MADVSQRRRLTRSPLTGRCLLIVEDDLFVGLDLSDLFEAMGGTVLGPVCELNSARRIATLHHVDMAVLDVEVAGGNTGDLARDLATRDIPFFFYTGAPDAILRLGLDAIAPVLAKPLGQDALRGAIVDLAVTAGLYSHPAPPAA